MYTLTKIGFDSLENHNPRYEELLRVVFDSYKDIDEFFKTTIITHYTGYDGQVYPQFRINEVKKYGN